METYTAEHDGRTIDFDSYHDAMNYYGNHENGKGSIEIYQNYWTQEKYTMCDGGRESILVDSNLIASN